MITFSFTFNLIKLKQSGCYEVVIVVITCQTKVQNSTKIVILFPSFVEMALSQIEIKLNWMPMIPSLVYMHGTRLTFGKPFVRKQYNVLIFLIVSAKRMEVLIELSEDVLL